MRIGNNLDRIPRGGFYILGGLFCIFASAITFGLSESTESAGSNAQAVHTLGYEGWGVNIGLISQDHTRITHEAFFDKDSQGLPVGSSHAHYYNATDQADDDYLPSSHDTSVGGILCSRGGASYPNNKGVAPQAELFSVKITHDGIIDFPWLEAALNHLLDQQCRVIATGIQLASSSLDPDGTSDWSLIYDYYAYEHNLIFATAAGNYDSSITTFGDTYNSITTGGLIASNSDLYGKVGSGSNPGPTIDGRQKPEISAPSQNQWVPINGNTSWKNEGTTAGQTSWSVPHTAGVAALLLNFADSTAEPDDDQNTVIKAVIVNSAFPNIQDENGNLTTGQVWDSHRGYGRIDALRSLELLGSPRIVPSSSTSGLKGWAFESLPNGVEHSYTIEGIENERLAATLTWNRRVVWNTSWSRDKTINNGELEGFPAENLDLEIYGPDSSEPLISEISMVDNLEKVDFRLTATGDYQIKIVNHSTNKSADYALAFELLPPIPGDVVVDYIVDILDLAELSHYWMPATADIPDAPYGIDLVEDGVIDLADFARLSAHWLDIDKRYYSVD